MGDPADAVEISDDLLAVGLGNPGDRYARTRHNVGVWVVDELIRRNGGRLKPSKREHSRVAEFRFGESKLIAACPATFMNESGLAVAQLVRRRGIEDLSRLIMVHDELDLPVGRMKLKFGGGLAGNNGLKSVKAHLHSTEFSRLRIGVGKPKSSHISGADHVLGRPNRRDRAILEDVVVQAAEAIEYVLSHGIESAMNQFNSP